MVDLKTAQEWNASLKQLGPGLVAVFGLSHLPHFGDKRLTRKEVGGTSGIGESTAREFVRNTSSPRVYIVGRNEEQVSRIQAELHALNPSSQVKFVKSDITLLKNIDRACAEIQAAEKQVNLLFMTAGFLALAGRTGKDHVTPIEENAKPAQKRARDLTRS